MKRFIFILFIILLSKIDTYSQKLTVEYKLIPEDTINIGILYVSYDFRREITNVQCEIQKTWNKKQVYLPDFEIVIMGLPENNRVLNDSIANILSKRYKTKRLWKIK
jgi:hypothetical protein